MTSRHITDTGRAYLRAVYLSGGDTVPAGPSLIGRHLGVSRVTALEQLKKLARLGYGTYVRGRGLLLNGPGIETTQEGIWRHHVVEHIFTDFFGHPSHEMVCREASRTSVHFSREFLEMAYEKMGRPENGKCGCPLTKPADKKDMEDCGWYQNLSR